VGMAKGLRDVGISSIKYLFAENQKYCVVRKWRFMNNFLNIDSLVAKIAIENGLLT